MKTINCVRQEEYTHILLEEIIKKFPHHKSLIQELEDLLYKGKKWDKRDNVIIA